MASCSATLARAAASVMPAATPACTRVVSGLMAPPEPAGRCIT
ncbi:hypothetical protein [Ottowia beijingensis]|nr:hypothetical protein [Ottowia beijingensis]